MGVDLLDVKIGLERTLGVEIPEADFLSRLRSHSERVESELATCNDSCAVLTVQQYFDIIVEAVRSRGAILPQAAWSNYVKFIAEIAGVEPDEIHPDDCLIRDLGF